MTTKQIWTDWKPATVTVQAGTGWRYAWFARSVDHYGEYVEESVHVNLDSTVTIHKRGVTWGPNGHAYDLSPAKYEVVITPSLLQFLDGNELTVEELVEHGYARRLA